METIKRNVHLFRRLGTFFVGTKKVITKMAGGIYSEKPFSPNLKCIIFACGIVILYWVASSSHATYYWLFPILFVGAYVIMAWYDYLYDCLNTMKSGTLGFDATFKPQDASEFKNRSTYLFHIVVLPILIYAGWMAYKGKENKGLYLFVVGLALVGLFYHSFRLFLAP